VISSEHRVLFLPDKIEISVTDGTSIVHAFHKAGLPIDAPCGGNGTCGKCMVRVKMKNGSIELKQACITPITEDIIIDIAHLVSEHRILQDGSGNQVKLDPMIKRVPVCVEKAKLGDIRSEWERLAEATALVSGLTAEDLSVHPAVVSSLYENLINYSYKADLFLCGSEVLSVSPQGSPFYAVAFDIGTTSIVGYLLDLESGNQLAVSSVLNPQSAYGADVVMRAKYSLENGVSILTNAVREALNSIIIDVAKQANIDSNDIYLISVAGNTCMHHLFLGVSPASLVFAPYNPAIRNGLILRAADCSIEVNPHAKLIALPNIAGFVGADTVAAILASDMDKSEKMTLLIDIGTNGEIVLGNSNGMIACSTAAGPAFEGALIECGMRGATGAIDHVSLSGGHVDYSVIGGKKPVGICGSGLIDAIAQLVQVGLIDETGKLQNKDHTIEGADLSSRVRSMNGKNAFVLVEADKSGTGSPIYITQKDIREVQLAKGAISAGIMLLAEQLGVSIDDVEQVFIAGAFGNYMSPESACQISLIPSILKNKITPIGNAAGEGSKRIVLNEDEFQRTKHISDTCGYLELAAHPEFQDTFIDCLSFSDMSK
jgi:uncharacterized 2Fe-2S/4Fe-4S cluster protein (DUF4445 family)